MNIKFNNSFPWLLACLAAFIVTFLIRLMLPTSENVQYSKSELQMPNVPFLEKEQKKNKDCYVLVALRNIKQYEKVTSQIVTWKKWPKEGISASFIAKDSDGNMLNSNYTYSNVINLYTKYPIVKGTPVTMNMLSRKRQENDTARQLAAAKRTMRKTIEKEVTQKVSKEFEKKLKDETEAIRKNEIIVHRDKVKSGMGVVSVPVDQRSMALGGFLSVGHRVDLLYQQRDRGNGFMKFKNVKILEIDGSSILGQIIKTAPRNITVEIEEDKLESLIKQITEGRQAIILVKNQHDVIREEISANPVTKLMEERTQNRRVNEFVKRTMSDTNLSGDGSQNSSNKILKFAINSFKKAAAENVDSDAISKSDKLLRRAKIAMTSTGTKTASDNEKEKRLLRIATNTINADRASSSESAKSNAQKVLKIASKAFENDALINDDNYYKNGGTIVVAKKNQETTKKYDKYGNIIGEDDASDTSAGGPTAAMSQMASTATALPTQAASALTTVARGLKR